MTKNVLDAAKRRVIALQTGVVHEQQFFLAGGTGLGLRLGHRVSRDIDCSAPSLSMPMVWRGRLPPLLSGRRK